MYQNLQRVSIFCDGRREGTYVLFPILNDVNNIQHVQQTTIVWKQSKETIHSNVNGILLLTACAICNVRTNLCDNKKMNSEKDNDDDGFNESEYTKVFDRVSKRISTLHPVNKLPKLLKRNDDNDNNNKKYSDHVLILLSALSKHNDDDNIDDSVRNNTSVDSIINTYLYSRRTSQRRNVHQRRRDL